MPTSERPRPNVLLTLACCVVVVAGLKAAGSVLLPFLLSILLAVVAMPVVRGLQSLRIPAGLAVALTVALLVGLFAGVGVFVGTSIKEFSDNVPEYQDNLRDRLKDWGIDTTSGDPDEQAPLGNEDEEGPATVAESATPAASDEGVPAADAKSSLLDVSDWLDPAAVMSFAGQVLNELVGMVSNLFLILLTTVFILLEAAGVPAKLRAAFPGDADPLSKAGAVGKSVQAYLGVKTLTSMATGICVTIWVGSMGLSHSVLWGLIAFLLNYVPSIGSMIAALPAVLLSLAVLGPGKALVILLGYLVINTIIGNVVEPRLMGRKLGLSPLVVFLSLLFWGWVWGPAGMLLSVPLTVMVKIILEGREGTRWIGVLLGPEAEARQEIGEVRSA